MSLSLGDVCTLRDRCRCLLGQAERVGLMPLTYASSNFAVSGELESDPETPAEPEPAPDESAPEPDEPSPEDEE